MSSEVLIADSKPRRLAYALERFEHLKRISLDPVAGLFVPRCRGVLLARPVFRRAGAFSATVSHKNEVIVPLGLSKAVAIFFCYI